MQNDTYINLTEMEQKILLLTAEGFNNTDIAEKLFISYHTVKSYLGKIFKKLNATDRTSAVYIASKKGII